VTGSKGQQAGRTPAPTNSFQEIKHRVE